MFTHLLPSTGMLAKTNGPCETLETKQMKLPAAEVCPRPDTDRALRSAAPPPFPPPLRAIPWEVAGAVLPMRTGEGGRIHTRGSRALHSIWNPARTRHCPVVPFQSILCSFVNLPGQPLPQHPAPNTQHPLSLCFQDRKLYQKWGTRRVAYHPHCTDGKVER